VGLSRTGSWVMEIVGDMFSLVDGDMFFLNVSPEGRRTPKDTLVRIPLVTLIFMGESVVSVDPSGNVTGSIFKMCWPVSI
jgi:hypothetical protein